MKTTMSENEGVEEQKEMTIKRLIAGDILQSPSVIRAIRVVPREEFLPGHLRRHAYVDTPLPIGHSQTISAIHMVSMMDEYLELEVGHRVLEIGAGCGYHACTVAEIVAPSEADQKKWGHVYTIEVIPELADLAQNNIQKTGYANRVTVVCGDGSLGLPSEAPFDRILVTAAAPDVPTPLVDQLKLDGVLIIPVGGLYYFQSLLKITKHAKGKIERDVLCSVAFVPLVGKLGFK